MKRLVAIALFSGLLVGAFFSKGCANRSRDAELTTPQSTVDQNMAVLEQLISKDYGTDSDAMSTLASFRALRQDPNSSLFYAEAPGSMGSLQTVMPDLDWNKYLGPDAQGKTYPITKIYVFLIVAKRAEGFRAAMIVAGRDAKASVNTTPTPYPTPVQTVSILGTRNFASVTPTPFPTATPRVKPTPIKQNQPIVEEDRFDFNFSMYFRNDAANPTAGLSAGDIVEGEFVLDLSLKSGTRWTLRSFDVVDDDLASTVQFEVYDSTYGQSSFIGLLNMAQPQ